ncbi:MAG: protein phosphatase 2C domain-containing protein [Propionibacteriaceae bacterium]|nr:protein phosphatase 2C domain-containing protein [Propionibacteriaceae bacterium]
MSEPFEPWPLLDAAEGNPQPAAAGRCPTCSYPVTAYAMFCEGCGAPLLPSESPPEPTRGGTSSTATRRFAVAPAAPCAECGGTVDPDGYCQTCGAKARNPRDHQELAPAEWLAGVSDRGVARSRNEDAVALWAAPTGQRAALVVADGVSTSIDSDAASLAAVTSACDLLAALPEDLSDDEVASALVAAAAGANHAVIAATNPASPNAASATFAAALVHGDTVHVASLGDSRIYWISAEADVALTLDDSMAQAFIAQGMPRDEAESMPNAHAITKWLGRDSEDVVPATLAHHLTEDGWLVLCSDGLWNYASAPSALGAQVRAALLADATPLEVARRLVEWANAQGGHDNVTVAVARCRATLGTPTAAQPEAGKGSPSNG